MKWFLGILLSFIMALNGISNIYASDKGLKGQMPEVVVDTSDTFRAGANQWLYMRTTCDVYYTERTVLTNYEEFKNITFGYAFYDKVNAAKKDNGNYDEYHTTGTLKYSFGGPIDGWEMDVYTRYYY